jgi:hypothetical protein
LARRAGPVAIGLTLAKILQGITPEPHRTGTIVYRVYGGKAGARGEFWTPVDPSQYKNEDAMRQALALPPSWGNTAQRLAVGYVKTENIKNEGPAQPQLDKATGVTYRGGGPEISVIDPNKVFIAVTKELKYKEDSK